MSTEHSHKSKGGRGKLFLSAMEVQNLHILLLYCMLVHLEVLVVWHEFQVCGPSFIAQFSTNQLALSPGSPVRPPTILVTRLDLSCMGVVLPGRLLPVLCLSEEAVSDTTSLHVEHISAGR